MTSYLLAGPAQEPVSLVSMKAFLRLEDDAEDGLVEALISAARIHIEAITARALLSQRWRAVIDGWPESRAIRLAVSPMIEIEAIRCFDEGDQAHEIEREQFLPDGQAVPARIICPVSVAGAPVLRARMGIEIDYLAGFGDAPEDVPGDLVQSLKTLVAYWFENRDSVIVSGAGASVPAGFERLVSKYKRVRL